MDGPPRSGVSTDCGEVSGVRDFVWGLSLGLGQRTRHEDPKYFHSTELVSLETPAISNL